MDLVQYGTGPGSAARLLAARNKNTINNNEFTLLLALTHSPGTALHWGETRGNGIVINSVK